MLHGDRDLCPWMCDDVKVHRGVRVWIQPEGWHGEGSVTDKRNPPSEGRRWLVGLTV
jgi:hypothetical protein